ncbi:MAG: alpha/beta hydrolase [Cyanobacteria bacterium SZAS-4]|nr:alpha/beta hydrolase [Cyanobacteria bacterium SZAS-4]
MNRIVASCFCIAIQSGTISGALPGNASRTTAKHKPTKTTTSTTKLDAKMDNDKFVGTWQGSLPIGNGMTLPLVFHFEESGAKLSGTLDSPAQNASGIKFDTITVHPDGSIVAAVAKLQAQFEGKIQPSKLAGVWKQGGSSSPLSLARSFGYQPPKRAQEPQPPFPYDSEQVSFKNSDVEISGTLTLPKDSKSCPVVVLLHGSGPHDRDETIFFHKPFLVLADYLTKRGIGVLRYDKRGCGKSTGDYKSATSNDFSEDGLAAINYLKTDARVNPAKIGLLGHSEGGLLAPIIADKSTDVSFLVMMAGAALPGDEILLGQVRKLGEGGGLPKQRLELECQMARETYAILKAEPDDKLAIDKIKAMRHRLNPQEDAAAEKDLSAQLAVMTSPWFRYFVSYDPRPMLSKVHCPMLAINGERDTQVLASENLDAIKKAVESNGNKQLTVITLPKLNHLFQTCSTGLPQEYSNIEETISPAALTVIGDWIAKQTESK